REPRHLRGVDGRVGRLLAEHEPLVAAAQDRGLRREAAPRLALVGQVQLATEPLAQPSLQRRQLVTHPACSTTGALTCAHMRLDLNDEERAFQHRMRTYFEGLVDEIEGGVRQHRSHYKDYIERLGDDGMLGLGWPPEYGGQ